MAVKDISLMELPKRSCFIFKGGVSEAQDAPWRLKTPLMSLLWSPLVTEEIKYCFWQIYIKDEGRIE